MHHTTTLSAPKEQGERSDPEPDSDTAVEWVDCAIKGEEIHPSGGQGVHRFSTRGLWGSTALGIGERCCCGCRRARGDLLQSTPT